MRWVEPYLGESVESDVYRVVQWVDHLAIDKGLVRATVSSYLTGVKQLLALHLVSSAALGPKEGARHVCVSLALLTVSPSEHSRVAYKPEWIMEGRQVWPCHVFVAVASIFLLALRQGEFISNYGGAATEHLLKWSNIRFLKWCGENGGGYLEMSAEEVRLRCADGLTVEFTSRKYQSRGVVREAPMRIRLSYGDGNPQIALWDHTVEVDLCVVTLLQFWFIHSGVTDEEVVFRPVMQLPDGSLLGSKTVSESIRMISRHHGVPDRDVVIHSLKHGALTTLGAAGCSTVDISMVGGHKSIESSQVYIHPSEEQGALVSQVLGRKRRSAEQTDV
jgi:hypothetical protein